MARKKKTRTELLQDLVNRSGLNETFSVGFIGSGFYLTGYEFPISFDGFLGKNYGQARANLQRAIDRAIDIRTKQENKKRSLEQKSIEMRRDNRMCRDDKCPTAVHCWRHAYTGRKPDRHQKYTDYGRGDREQCEHFVESWTG